MISRGRMHFDLTDDGQVRCCIALQTKQGEEVVTTQLADSTLQAFKRVVARAQQRLRELEDKTTQQLIPPSRNMTDDQESVSAPNSFGEFFSKSGPKGIGSQRPLN